MADKSLNKDTSNLDDTVWDHTWGYADTKLFVHPEDMTVEMTGSRYNLCGYRMPYLIPFAREVLGADIDFSETRPTVKNPPVAPARSNEGFVNAIKNKLGPQQSAQDDRIRLIHSHGQTTVDEVSKVIYDKIDRVVDLVVYPESQEDCVAIIEAAREHNVCLIPYGGGTNVSSALMIPESETRMVVSVDMRRMDKIEWIDRTNMRASVQAGILGSKLEALLEKEGLTTGHEPDSVELSTLGGWIATNASGMKRNRYGTIEDIVEGMTLVTPSGIVEERHPMARVAMGTQVQKALFGSEGNLGLITRAVVKLHKLPEAKKYDAYVFKDWKTGVAFMYDLYHTGVVPASIRLVDNTQFRFSQALKPAPEGMGVVMDKVQNFVLKSVKGFDSRQIVVSTLVFEGSAQEVAFQEKVVGDIAKKHGAVSAGATNGQRGYMLTYAIAYIRDLFAAHYIIGETYETTCPWSRIQEVCDAVARTVEAEHKAYGFPGKPYSSPRLTQMYRSGVCIYFTHGFYHKGVENAEEKFAEMEKTIRQAIMDAGGSISHHHGVGKLRQQFLPQTMTPTSEHIVRELKSAVDPENIFGVRNNVLGE